MFELFLIIPMTIIEMKLNTFLILQVLEVVLKHAGERRIVFSCFNPDICTLVRNKQNKYPVMFLTQVCLR